MSQPIELDLLHRLELNRLYIAITVTLLCLMVVGWFLTTFIVPTQEQEQLDRGRRERMEFQCRVERRFDMKELSCPVIQK